MTMLSLFAGSLVALAQVPVETQPLKPFEFKGITAGAEVDMSKLKACKKGKGPDTQLCKTLDSKVAGFSMYPAPKVLLYKNKLNGVQVIFYHWEYDGIIDAFTTKYGKPCKTGEAFLQNGFGAKFPYAVNTWCFSTGQLIVSQYNVTQNSGIAMYVDLVNTPPSEKPTIDF